jgi:hypothetical protein
MRMRISLRNCLIFLTLGVVALFLWSERSTRQHMFVRKILNEHGRIKYQDETDPFFTTQKQVPFRHWVYPVHPVRHICLYPTAGCPVDKQLAWAAGLPGVQEISILHEHPYKAEGLITDEGLRTIMRIPSLKSLMIVNDRISEEQKQKLIRERPGLTLSFEPP